MKRLAGLAFASLMLLAAPAHAVDVSWVLELPLTQGQAAVQGAVQSHGGTISGGSFSAEGWTTTTRGDSIEVPLPASIDARRGVLELSFTQPELPGPTGYFESYVLLSLDRTGAPYEPTAAGRAGIQSLYVAWNELDQPLKKLKGYFNLEDPGCSDWHLCTGEAGSGNGWLGDGAAIYTIVHSWDGAVDQLHMEGGSSNVNKSVDLTTTSPVGVIDAPQLYLTVNPCGGSNSNACGLWNGPHHGGPLGTTYVAVRLELRADCGDGACSTHIEDCQSCAVDCCGGSGGQGGSDQGGSDQGGAATGGSGAGGSGGSAGGGGSSSSSSAGSNATSDSSALEGGCQLGSGRTYLPGAWLALALLAAVSRRRRQSACPSGCLES